MLTSSGVDAAWCKCCFFSYHRANTKCYICCIHKLLFKYILHYNTPSEHKNMFIFFSDNYFNYNIIHGKMTVGWNTCPPQEFHLGRMSLSCWKIDQQCSEKGEGRCLLFKNFELNVGIHDTIDKAHLPYTFSTYIPM